MIASNIKVHIIVFLHLSQPQSATTNN